MEAVANIVCVHKIVKLLAKNLSLDDCQLADFVLGDTQQQNGGLEIAFFRREKRIVVCKNGASKPNHCVHPRSSRSFKTKSDIKKISSSPPKGAPLTFITSGLYFQKLIFG